MNIIFANPIHLFNHPLDVNILISEVLKAALIRRSVFKQLKAHTLLCFFGKENSPDVLNQQSWKDSLPNYFTLRCLSNIVWRFSMLRPKEVIFLCHEWKHDLDNLSICAATRNHVYKSGPFHIGKREVPYLRTNGRTDGRSRDNHNNLYFRVQKILQ